MRATARFVQGALRLVFAIVAAVIVASALWWWEHRTVGFFFEIAY